MTQTITIKFADKTIEVEEFFFNGEGMAQDTLNTFGFYPDVVETLYSDEGEARDVFETLEARKQSLLMVEEFSQRSGIALSDAFDICFDGFDGEEYQANSTSVSGEHGLIDGNINAWIRKTGDAIFDLICDFANEMEMDQDDARDIAYSGFEPKPGSYSVTQNEFELVKSNLGEKRIKVAFARLGGSSRSEAKAKAARENGKKGGRPRKKD